MAIQPQVPALQRELRNAHSGTKEQVRPAFLAMTDVAMIDKRGGVATGLRGRPLCSPVIDQETKVEELKRFVEVLEDEKKQLNIRLTQDIQVGGISKRLFFSAVRLSSPRHARCRIRKQR